MAMLDRRLILNQDQDPIVQDVIRNTLKPGSGFIDIGANIGYFSVLAAVRQRANVWSFEPSPRELEILYYNLALNRCSSVTVFPVALGASRTKGGLNIAGLDNPGMNSFCDLSTVRSYVGQQLVEIGPLADYITPRQLLEVRLCKIDVEGYEVEVLNGIADCMQLLKGATFVVEISPGFLEKNGNRPREIYDFFARHGFLAEQGNRDEKQWDEVFRLRA